MFCLASSRFRPTGKPNRGIDADMDVSDTAAPEKDLAARQKEILEELDKFYKGVEEHEGPYPNGEIIMAVERELFEALAHVTYDIHRESRAV